ncbi:MAG: ornithine carbamoyltransferase [Oscillospiraceae bacterium]|nr:ornithine carbamoyltransferase [Oscillospiraceae bacterium]
MKHLLKLLDLSSDEIIGLLDFADDLKRRQNQGEKHELLKGKTLAMIFEKSSTRTRVSFETGMFQLGGHALCLLSSDLQISRGEPLCDTARVMSRYVDGIMIRTYGQKIAEDLAKYGSVPVINGLTDLAHPCQVLADLMTIREYKGKLEGLKLCYIGDGNNMANSLIVGGLKTGMTVSAACPPEYQPDPLILDFAKEYSDFTLTPDPKEAAKNADVLVTDVWSSMGQEKESSDRRKIFEGKYQINPDIMQISSGGAIVLHCLPAHRGEEITEDVFEAHADEIFTEAENRLHAQKAVLATLMRS